jgi:hypothetical protein
MLIHISNPFFFTLNSLLKIHNHLNLLILLNPDIGVVFVVWIVYSTK